MLAEAIALTVDQFIAALGLTFGLFFALSLCFIVGMEIGRSVSARRQRRWREQTAAARECVDSATKPYAAIGGVDRDFHRRAG